MGLRQSICKQCGRTYTAKKTGNYCSDACRAKASRARHGAIVDNASAAYARRAASKSAHTIQVTCRQCGATFAAAQANRLYCSPRCKKAAFNARHEGD